MFGVYVMIGKPVDEIWRLYDILSTSGALEYSTIIVSRNDDFMSKQLLTPYTGAAVADFYKFYGMNSFVIYDDFTVHNRICSKLHRESQGLMTYGNWSGELLERATQLNARYGNGSHTALCIADKPKDDDELNVESETFYNYLPFLVSHVDEHMMLSDDSFNANMVPPISLFPVPYGVPKFMKYNMENDGGVGSRWNRVLLKLSVNVKKRLFELVELEAAARHQMELNLDLEPDVERIASNVYKLQKLFTQNEEVGTRQLILLLLCMDNGLIEYIHLDKIDAVERRLYEHFSDDEKWNGVCKRIEEEEGSEYDIENDLVAQQLVHDFLDENSDLCQPNALGQQNLETDMKSEFY